MASHADCDHQTQPTKEDIEKMMGFSEAIQAQADELTKNKGNIIAAGDLHGEQVLREEKVGMFLIRELPEDPLALRISIGEGNQVVPDSAYMVFRGRPNDICQLLERAISALKASHFEY